ncbi:hypothetical protein [Pontibaca salina]|uniref:Uncharacterized protein n=1 Tax=Pontibaca salina TaxID=2795731 RepID=A0A934HHN4_9RHOB|nr:hypothetical protein [Pontibaca salina]MBI6628338.1 hypothetical protein [Pontibaca salina]
MSRAVKLKRGTRDFAKPRGKVSLAQPRWDHGASGPANRIGLVAEDRGPRDVKTGKVINPNGVKGVRRVDMLEIYHSRGWISDRGYTAGERLRDAWAATQKSKGMDWSAERVDSTPRPDAMIDIQVERVSRLTRVTRCIQRGDEDILWAVVGEGRSVGHLPRYRAQNHGAGREHLYEALDRLADAMGC